MNRLRSLRCLWRTAWIVGLGLSHLGAAQLIDDRAITIRTADEIAARRAALIAYIWGADGFPHQRLPAAVKPGIASPVRQLADLRRVDELRIELAAGLEGLAYHFVPERPNHELVVLHHGHACSFDDDPAPENVGHGFQRTIRALLLEGYDVLAVYMPRYRPGDCVGQHGALFRIPTTGSPMRFFLDSTAVSLNHLKARREADQRPAYRAHHMVGLSGGGWTATVYAAIDPTIRRSISVAGTMPLYLRSKGSVGDREQFEPSFYRLAGYPDLYVLGAHGESRRQVQVVIRRDQCCFGEAQHDSERAGLPYAESLLVYEQNVRAALEACGPGSFTVHIDEAAPDHMISHQVIRDVILPTLRAKG